MQKIELVCWVLTSIQGCCVQSKLTKLISSRIHTRPMVKIIKWTGLVYSISIEKWPNRIILNSNHMHWSVIRLSFGLKYVLLLHCTDTSPHNSQPYFAIDSVSVCPEGDFRSIHFFVTHLKSTLKQIFPSTDLLSPLGMNCMLF